MISRKYFKIMPIFKLFFFLFTLSFFELQNTYADDSKSSNTTDNDFENLGLIHKDVTNKYIQEFWVLGRYHGQYHFSDGNVGEDDGFESRRIRAGFQGKFFNNFVIHAQSISGSDFNPAYNGFSELWAQWNYSKSLQLTLGQQKHRFTHDRNVSSRYINYLERGMLTNMFNADYTPAATVSGQFEKFNYYTGVFTNATGRNMHDSFSEFDSGYSLLFASYFDAKDYIPTETAYLHFSLLHSESKESATNLRRFRQGISSALILTEGSTSVITELLSGVNDKEGNAFGVNFQPGMFVSEEIQLVSRYQLALSNKSEGLNPQSRYEREAGVDKGDLYQAIYGGVNYYIARHRCKLMFGVEYANMNGEYVWTSSAMFRMFFGPHSGGAFPMNVMLPGLLFDYD